MLFESTVYDLKYIINILIPEYISNIFQNRLLKIVITDGAGKH